MNAPHTLPSRLMLLALTALAASLVILGTASSQPDGDKDVPPPPLCQTYVGALEGGPASARIGIVTEQGNFLVYLCSKDQKFNESFSRWLKGKLGEGGKFDAENDGVKITGFVKGELAQGEVSGPGGATLKFSAKQVSACSNAGLYRASEVVDDDEQLAGWVVDAQNDIAGAVQSKKKKIGLPGPQNADNNNLVGVGGQVNAQKVNSAVKPGNGTKGRNPLGKIDPNTRAEILQDLSARFAKRDGSPLLAAFVGLAKKAQSGAKGSNPTETKLLNIVRKAGAKGIADYVKNWEALPQNLRTRLIGSSANLASGKVPIDNAALVTLSAKLPRRAKVPVQPAKVAAVKSVQIRQLVCVDETNPEFIGSDEIFVVYQVIQGQKVFNPQGTKIYTGLDTGKTAQFTGADVTVFPPPGQAAGEGEIEISASIFEDDSNDNKVIAQVVSAAAEAATEILKTAGAEKASNVTQALSDFFDGIAGVFPSTQFLGSDAIVVRPNGQLTSITGASKNFMTVERFRKGDRVYRYDLKNIVVAK